VFLALDAALFFSRHRGFAADPALPRVSSLNEDFVKMPVTRRFHLRSAYAKIQNQA
jgi:hypothetical protein